MRRISRQVVCGGVVIGGGAPVAIQSMTNTDTRDVRATADQIRRLEEAGCEIVRVSVPDQQAADALKEIRKFCRLPLVADIHFDYRLAVESIRNGADKIRINPGNIGAEENVSAVVKAAKERRIPIRIGVNSGSIERDLLKKYGGPCAEGLAESALRNVQMVRNMGFEDIVLSAKASDAVMNYQAHLLIADKTDCPLHIGVTESGTPSVGIVKSAAGLGALLLAGIGDTIRVSLTGDPVNEIMTAKMILRTLGLRTGGIELVSCPTCGRTEIDLIGLAEQVEKLVADYDHLNIKVAVMGCVVNGPGEAKEADLGIAGGKGCGILIKKGQIIKKVDEKDILSTLKYELDNWSE